MKTDLGKRSHEVEIMDDLLCAGEVVDQTLRELETINRLLGGNYVTINALDVLLKHTDSKNPIRIADLGCGGGDMLVRILKHADRKGWKVYLLGIDANPNIIRFARNNIRNYPMIRFETVNIFSPEFREQEMDIAIGTLFFHHFTTEELSNFFRQLYRQIKIGIIINDIHRHPLAYHSIRWLTQLFSKSAMVKFDAPLSVRRAFTKSELQTILANAGIKEYSLRWKWAFRWQVIIPAQTTH